MAKTQGYNVGKKGGAFWFGTDPVVATLVVNTRFSSCSCAL
jgi:hypothetical protein